MRSLDVTRGDVPRQSPTGIAEASRGECGGARGADDAASSLFRFGMMHLTGDGVPVDLVAAHKWFNLAAMRGSKEAVRLRREIATEMTPSEIAAAQRAARNWQFVSGTDRVAAE